MRIGQLRKQEEPGRMTKSFEVPKALVWEAYQRVKANGGSPGVDQESIERFERRLGDNLYVLWNRICSGSYFPPPVKGVPIPKKSGGVRLLGVPTVADRVAQTVVKLVLEPILEPRFHPNSYGYRPGRSALDAVAMVRRRCWDYDWVIEFDIKGLFDNKRDIFPRFLNPVIGILPIEQSLHLHSRFSHAIRLEAESPCFAFFYNRASSNDLHTKRQHQKL
ncbi:MAG: reverse transcriptase domain-containing protein [Rhodanobacter sp.]